MLYFYSIINGAEAIFRVAHKRDLKNKYLFIIDVTTSPLHSDKLTSF
jgi:hypothetical protein